MRTTRRDGPGWAHPSAKYIAGGQASRAPRLSAATRWLHAFTLIEVMIAVGIFCICLTAILAVMTRGLAQARALQTSGPDAGTVAAQLSVTNGLEDGETDSGDFGTLYPGYSWEYSVSEFEVNGVVFTNLYEVDIHVYRQLSGRKTADSIMSILRYDNSGRRRLGGASLRR